MHVSHESTDQARTRLLGVLGLAEVRRLKASAA